MTADVQEVVYRGDWISWRKYQPLKAPRDEPEAKKNDIAETLNTANVEPTRSQDFKLPNVAYGPDVKIKATKAGLTFSGLTETCLNVHPCDFVYPGQACISTEQGIQHQINSY